MNARVRYITAAIFLFIFEMLVSYHLWLLAVIFGLITVVYICLEFNGLRPKYFIRITALLIMITYFLTQLNFLGEGSMFTELQSFLFWSGKIIEHYVLLGIHVLANIIHY